MQGTMQGPPMQQGTALLLKFSYQVSHLIHSYTSISG